MRRERRGIPERTSFALSITPMIDVVFLLLVYFLLTSGFVSHERLLRTEPDDAAVTRALYLRTLAREPDDDELRTCLDHVRGGDRVAGFEDVFWALVNSAEFVHRR